MKKGKITNIFQRAFIFGSVAVLMTGLVFNGGNLTKATGTISSKVETCTLESVTVKSGEDKEQATAPTTTYEGGLEPIIVGGDVVWNDYFSIQSITAIDFKVSEDCTSTEDDHNTVSAYVFLPEGAEYTYNDFRSNKQSTDNGAWIEIMNTDLYNSYSSDAWFGCVNHISEGYVTLDDNVGYYDVKFEPRFNMVDGTSPTGIYVRFAKEYNITYELNDGEVADTDELKATYVAGTETTLPNPTREGYYFTGWTSKTQTTPTRDMVISTDSTGDLEFTANWVRTTSIVDSSISLKNGDVYGYVGGEVKPEVVVKDGETVLVEGTDYTVSYENNVKVAGKDTDNAPTVIVTGAGKYSGTNTITFTIEKGTLTVVTDPTASSIEEGKKLSDATLTGGKVVNAQNTEVEGTFAWKDGETVPTMADSATTKYIVIFTPTDINGYETVETEVTVAVSKVDEEIVQPEVGDNLADKDNKATYKITKVSEDGLEVSYVAPTSKTKTVSIPATVTLENGTTAKVTSIEVQAFKGNTKVQTVTIGKNVKTIGKEAFKGCKKLTKVKGASNVTSIGKNAFANCTKLTSVAMSTKLTTIGEKAFYNCTALKKITIPKNVKSIGKSAFQKCKNLKSITIKTTKLTKKNVKSNAFKGIPSKAKINVPNSKVKAYKSILRARGVSKKATIK